MCSLKVDLKIKTLQVKISNQFQLAVWQLLIFLFDWAFTIHHLLSLGLSFLAINDFLVIKPLSLSQLD